MGKFKKIVMAIAALVLSSSIALSAAGCGNKNKYPDFYNPENPTENNDQSADYYTVSVVSAGGIPLNDVSVSAVNSNGETVLKGVSVNGKIRFDLDAGEYTLVVDESSLPAGYYTEGQTYKMTASERKVTLSIPSKVIAQTAESGHKYSLGDIMHDFSYTNTEGEKVRLSSLVEVFPAVIINFWYIDCPGCRNEFPAMQSAYSQYSDKVAIVALSNKDNPEDIAQFREEFGLSFDMAFDTAGITNMFNLSGFPTTYVVDRYGALAYSDDGAIVNEKTWTSIFDYYTSDNYVQTDHEDEKPDGPVTEREKPTAAPSDYAEIASAVNGQNSKDKIVWHTNALSEEDKAYNWPWVIDGDSITPSNVGHDFSYSIINFDVTLKKYDILTIEYSVNTEDGSDVLYLFPDRNDTGTYSENARIDISGNSDGFKTQTLYVAENDVTLECALAYNKDDAEAPEGESVKIKNVSVTHLDENTTTPTDFRVSCAGADINPVLGTDGYYHVGSEDGALILFSLTNTTAWSRLRYGAPSFESPEKVEYPASMYFLSIYNEDINPSIATGKSFEFNYYTGNGDERADRYQLVADYYWMQDTSDNDLLPVSDELLNLINEFIDTWYRVNGKQPSSNDNEWLEMCYYYQHFGASHDKCFKSYDPAKGASLKNPLVAPFDTTFKVDNYKANSSLGGGVYYEFTSPQKGVYKFESSNPEKNADPLLNLFRLTENENGEPEFDMFAAQDNALSPDNFTKDPYSNFCVYAFLEAGEKIYLQCTMDTASVGSTLKYDTKITYVGATHKELTVCTTGEGVWTYEVDENGVMIGDAFYAAIKVAYEGAIDCYRAIDEEGNLWSKIYIDFIHPTYFDQGYKTLEQFIDEGNFDFRKYGGQDRTAEARKFCDEAKNKDKSDPLYGMVEASRELVNLLGEFTNWRYSTTGGADIESGYWLSMACYYAYYGYDTYTE